MVLPRKSKTKQGGREEANSFPSGMHQPWPRTDPPVTAPHSNRSAARLILGVICRSGCQKEMVFIEIENQAFPC